MRFLNVPHEPTSLVISRFLFLAIGVIGLSLIASLEIAHLTEQKDVYQVEYNVQPLALPTILFRSIAAPNVVYFYNFGVMTTSGFNEYGMFKIDDAIKSVEWNQNVTDSSYQTRDWKRVSRRKMVSPSLNNSELDMKIINPNLNHVFVPKFQSNSEKTSIGNKLITRLHMRIKATIPNDEISATMKIPNFQVDMFVIDNPDLLDPKKHTKPFDLAILNSKARFTIKSGTNVMFDFIESHMEKGNYTKKMYDFGVYEQPGQDSTAIEFTIAPRNEPSADNDNFMVKKEIARRPVSVFQAIGAIGGGISMFMAVFAILFGQRRLRPWGIIQRYLMRSKILSLLPQFMVSIKSSYRPKFEREPDNGLAHLHVLNPYKLGTKISSMPVYNTHRSKSPNNDTSENIPTITINCENENPRTVDTRTSEISELKAMMNTQMEQFTIMSNRLATLESNPSANSSIIMPTQPATFESSPSINSSIIMPTQPATFEGNLSVNSNSMMPNLLMPCNMNSSNTSTAQSSKISLSTSEALPIETRVASLEAFQYRLGTFYLASDLFKDTSFE